MNYKYHYYNLSQNRIFPQPFRGFCDLDSFEINIPGNKLGLDIAVLINVGNATQKNLDYPIWKREKYV